MYENIIQKNMNKFYEKLSDKSSLKLGKAHLLAYSENNQ